MIVAGACLAVLAGPVGLEQECPGDGRVGEGLAADGLDGANGGVAFGQAASLRQRKALLASCDFGLDNSNNICILELLIPDSISATQNSTYSILAPNGDGSEANN